MLRERLTAAADALEAIGEDEVRLAFAYRVALPYLVSSGLDSSQVDWTLT